MIDAVRDERILVKDLEPLTRRIAAVFKEKGSVTGSAMRLVNDGVSEFETETTVD